MDDVKKMFQTLVNGQSAIKSELLGEIAKVRKEFSGLDEKVGGIKKEIKDVEKRLTKRINMIGRQIAILDDDAPTRQEYEDLDKRVSQLEQKTGGYMISEGS